MASIIIIIVMLKILCNRKRNIESTSYVLRTTSDTFDLELREYYANTEDITIEDQYKLSEIKIQ